MYNLNNKIHRYYTQGENDTIVEYRFDSSVCKTCELMNKAERCINTIKKLAKNMQFMSNGEAFYITPKGGKLFRDGATHRFKLDIQKAIREAYK
jgi:hypothetical protein